MSLRREERLAIPVIAFASGGEPTAGRGPNIEGGRIAGFPIDPANPFKDPPGMTAARRRFEKKQEISKAMEILRLRGAFRDRR